MIVTPRHIVFGVLLAALALAPLPAGIAIGTAVAADGDSPAAREEREHRWYEDRRERLKRPIEQKKKEDAARERLEQRIEQREKEYQERKRQLDSETPPETSP